MLGILVHGDNHFIARGPLPDRETAIALVRHWSLIQGNVQVALAQLGDQEMFDRIVSELGGAFAYESVRKLEFLGGKPAVIVFYRGGWCPYCNITLRAYQAQLVPALAERGIGLVAISPQAPDGSLSAKESKELTFTVLSDPGNQIAGQLGILTAPSDGTRAGQLQLGLDLTQVNADGTTGLPMPTVVIADADGVIRWIDVHPDYTTMAEPGQVLQAVTDTIS